MANEGKQSFPMLPPKNWWALRKRFQQTIPAKVTAGYLAPVLSITEKSAQNNVLPYLRTLGLIDEEGKPTELANKWRFDDNYSEVCKEIKEKIYPRELLDAIPNPSENRPSAEGWFAGKTGSGQVAARRMTTLYCLLCDADPSKGDDISIKKTPKKAPQKAKKVADRKEIQLEPKVENQIQTPGIQSQSISPFPSIHIDLQIHLSPEAGAEQIDQIFASMSKHLKGFFPKPSKTE